MCSTGPETAIIEALRLTDHGPWQSSTFSVKCTRMMLHVWHPTFFQGLLRHYGSLKLCLVEVEGNWGFMMA